MLDLSMLGFTEVVGLTMYIVPLVVCFFGYLVLTTQDVLKDRHRRATLGDSYWPVVRVSDVLGRVLCVVLPIVNLLAMIFDVAPRILGSLFKWLGRWFDKPIVPPRSKNGS